MWLGKLNPLVNDVILWPWIHDHFVNRCKMMNGSCKLPFCAPDEDGNYSFILSFLFIHDCSIFMSTKIRIHSWINFYVLIFIFAFFLFLSEPVILNVYVMFIHLFLHFFIRSFVHSFIHSFVHSLIHSFIHSFIHSYIHSYIHSFIHSFTHSFTPWLQVYVVWTRSWTRLCSLCQGERRECPLKEMNSKI